MDEYADQLVDRPALESYLGARLGPAENWSISRLEQGHSNETLLLDWDDRSLVLRRPPAGETADTAHDVLREYTVVDALQNTPVPVPDTVLACDDASIIGGQFYLMERVDGTVPRDEEPERFASPDHRERLGIEHVDTLAAIHSVDYEAVGLGDFGHPEGYTARQVRRWSEQYTWAFERTGERREVPAVYELMEWLLDNVPEEQPAPTLVQGDYKLDNVMFAPGTPPELVAVFDWELATLGDPLTDLGWMLSFWRGPADPAPALPGMTPRFMERDGYPTRAELVDRYEQQTGVEYRNDRFYRALAVYKLGAMGEMFFRRYLEGGGDDPLYPKMEDGVPALAERGLRIAQGEEPL